MKMTKKDVELTVNQLCGSSNKYINKEDGQDYLRRITIPLRNKNHNFEDEFLDGEGFELKNKFWSNNSSSRLAFDLYSWIIENKNVINFEFEKKLPGIICRKSGPYKVPDMDVFIETRNNMIFIESKFTESFPGLIYKDKLVAYWDKEFNPRYKDLPIYKRFYDNSSIANYFSDFCCDIQNNIDNNPTCLEDVSTWKWFNPKQETTHLFGIIFYLLQGYKDEDNVFRCHKSPEQVNQKGVKINFVNIIFPMKGDVFKLTPNSLPEVFRKKAIVLMENIGFSCFNYSFMSVFDLLRDNNFLEANLDFTTARTFGDHDKSVSEKLEQYYWAKGKIRSPQII